jgi:hypothetical protein
MTWADWVASDYNTIGLWHNTVDNKIVATNGRGILDINNTYVQPSDYIILTQQYFQATNEK